MTHAASIDYTASIDSLAERFPALANATVPSSLTRYWGQTIGWPDGAFSGTGFASSEALPEFISVADDLRVVAKLIDTAGERAMFEAVANWRYVPGDAVAIFAPDLVAALHLWSAAVDTANPQFSIDFVEGTDESHLRLGLHPAIGAMLGFVEISVMMLLSRTVQTFAGFTPASLRLRDTINVECVHASPEQLALATEICGITFKRGQETGCLRFSSGLLEVPNPEYNDAKWLARKAEVERENSLDPRGMGLSDQSLRALILRSLVQENRMLQVPEVARFFGVSDRTLARNLASEGLSLRDIGRDARMRLSVEYLRDSGYSVGTIANLLGYTETSSFVRSFRSQFGVSPGRWREANGARSAGS